jgi:dolichol-phosphate mannosyltransferase
MTTPPRDVQTTPVLSIIIPLLNEEEVLEETYVQLKKHLGALDLTYEMIFVDDGSTDGSRALLAAKSMTDPTVRVVGLSRNFGHEMATTAGLHHARGQAAVVIDADVPIPPDTGDFRLMDRCVLDVYQKFNEEPRFFRGLVGWIGFRQIGIPFVRRQRVGGRTKYRYNRLLKLAFDTITAFSTLPALFITILAGAIVGLSVLLTVVVLVLWATGLIALEGWMWAALGFLALWNIQFCCIAVLGEYIVRTHRHTQRRPLFVVESLIEGGASK